MTINSISILVFRNGLFGKRKETSESEKRSTITTGLSI